MYHFTEEQIKQLDIYRSEACFVKRCAKVKRTVLDGEIHEEIATPGNVKVQIRDKRDHKVWMVAVASTEAEALDLALDQIDPSMIPKTPAEIAQENVALREELAALKGETPPPPVDAPALPTGPPSPVPTSDEPLPGLNPKEMVQSLKSRGITPPEGNRTSPAWMEEAVALLRAHEPNTT